MAGKSQTTEVKTQVLDAILETRPSEVISGRKKLLELTDDLIEETYNRVSGERFRVREGDRERLAYLRTLVSLIALHDSLLKGSSAPSLESLDPASIRAKIAEEKRLHDMFTF
ncbi:hypothetical protein Mboo_0509 [Methanoregula boonei 6A8]|jgi:hypothetical protein|uniref:Uncharacterized protein n=1 Tax=Methanoregula boonei (strain DSM 21154 / JCM 14090 / 6A8) TaxID=456442 RepID=A7I5L6_METB6|nr:hypothetical protein [Methanoregula boonei]ABS55027.1 hypothetical protein Mboo_0509 [Methanoregula boonei 6A8]